MRNIRTSSAVALALGFTFGASTIQAANFNVSNGSELQAALTTAQSNGEADTILLAAGTYDASAGTFSYIADATLGSEENFPLTLRGADGEAAVLDGGDSTQVMSIDTSVLPDDSNADILIQKITFQNGNTGNSGGGLLVITDDGDVTVLSSKFLDNESTNYGGGADFILGNNSGGGNLVVNGCLFEGNSAPSIGAAEFIVDAGGAVATNNIFFQNESTSDVGALLFQYFSGAPSGAPLTLVNNTFVQNSAGTDYGALELYAFEAGETYNVYNNLFFENSAAGIGDDIFVDIDSAVTLNLFNNNFAEICFDASSNCDPASNPNVNFGENLNVDPLFIDVAAGNFSLALGSPVIDQGDPAAPELPSLDYVGNPRVVGTAPDIGAIEAQPEISASPEGFAFDEISVGDQETQILTLANEGVGPLVITATTLSDNVNFTLDASSGDNPCGSLTPTLDGGESCTLGVVFAPRQGGDFRESLMIDSNDASEPHLSFGLLSGSPDGGGCSLQSGASPSGFAVAMLGTLALLGLRLRRD